jgi:hypothetical protein
MNVYPARRAAHRVSRRGSATSELATTSEIRTGNVRRAILSVWFSAESFACPICGLRLDSSAEITDDQDHFLVLADDWFPSTREFQGPDVPGVITAAHDERGEIGVVVVCA